MPLIAPPVAVSAAYAAGPASSAISPAAAPTVKSGPATLPNLATSRKTTAASASTAIVGHSQLSKLLVRRSSTIAHTADTAMPSGSTQAQAAERTRKARKTATPPPPVRAAIAGASMVV